MSSSIEKICESLSKENLIVQEIIHIPKDYISLSLSDTSCLLTIDLSKQYSASSNNTYSDVYIIKLNNQRNLITATVNKIYSAAQLLDYIKKSKLYTPQQILNKYGIHKKDYLVINKSKVKFRSQKLVSNIHSHVKIDCSNYVIISES